MALVLVICLFISTTTTHSQEEPKEPEKHRLTEDEVEDLWEKLYSPAAYDRLMAAIDLQPYVTKKDMKRLIYGHLRHWNNGVNKGTEVTEPSIMGLIELLSGGWPDAADDFEDDIYGLNDSYFDEVNKYLKEKGEKEYEVENQMLFPAIGYLLFRHGKFGGIEEESFVCEWVREYYYEDWISRVPNDFIWTIGYYDRLAKSDWLWEFFSADKNISKIDKIVVKILRKESTEEYDMSLSFRQMLLDAYTTNTPPPIDINTTYQIATDFGMMSRVEIISMILNKPEWIPALHKELIKAPVKRYTRVVDPSNVMGWSFKVEETEEDIRNTVLVAKLMADEGKDQEMLDFLEPYIRGDRGLEYNKEIENIRAILHHPWCESIREVKGFKELWKENTTKAWEEPDPFFKTIDWNRP